jgi:isopenicillin-N N-acyltransferase like protein
MKRLIVIGVAALLAFSLSYSSFVGGSIALAQDKAEKKFKVIECSGSQYDMGVQYGKACKANVVKSIKMPMGALKALYGASREDVLANAKKYLPASQKLAPGLMEFLKGTAKGAGVSFEEVFALRTMLEQLEYYGAIKGLCTSFAATGAATENGKTIVGQNIDWSPNFPIDLLHLKPKKGPESLTIAFGGILEWSLTSKGLGLAMNLTLTPPKEQTLTVPTGVVAWKAMQQKNIGDALGIFAANARGLLNYVLASADGNLLQIESTPDDYNVLYPERDFMVHSNHYLTERFKSRDNVVVCCPDSYVRLERIKKLMNKHYGKLSPQVMMKLLADHSNYPSAICRHVDKDKPPVLHFETLVSVIMVPEDKTMYVAFGQPCKTKYVKYQF